VADYSCAYPSSSSPKDNSLALFSFASFARLAFLVDPLPPSFPLLLSRRLLNFNFPEASVYSMGSSGGGAGFFVSLAPTPPVAPAASPPPPFVSGAWFHAEKKTKSGTAPEIFAVTGTKERGAFRQAFVHYPIRIPQHNKRRLRRLENYAGTILATRANSGSRAGSFGEVAGEIKANLGWAL